LESGKDGVGDYTRLLARSLEQLGISTLCVALNDRHIANLETSTSFPGSESNTVRLSVTMSWKERQKVLQTIINDFRPDWVSLQYVPYGYHPKGMPLGLPRLLGSLRGNFRWHIMYHELWVGDGDSPLKTNFYYGLIQRRIATRLHKNLHALSHTSNPYYCDRLQLAGCLNSVLPLFSNIGIIPPDPNQRTRLLAQVGIAKDSATEDSTWIFMLFGTIYPHWEPAVLLERLERTRQLAGKSRCLVVAMGNLGAEGDAMYSEMLSKQTESLRFLRTGMLSEQQISSLLQCADFGITTSPLLFLGKSGSTAAMLEHGLPVIVSRLERIGKSAPSVSKRIIPLDQNFEQALMNTRRVLPHSGLGNIARAFAGDLGNHPAGYVQSFRCSQHG
jgi:glycosyltransferase involved in cell wall biosynthesis